MPPITLERRKANSEKVTNLISGAKFELFFWYEQDGAWRMIGQYLDYAGGWVTTTWDDKGQVAERQFADHDLNWRTARPAGGDTSTDQ